MPQITLGAAESPWPSGAPQARAIPLVARESALDVISRGQVPGELAEGVGDLAVALVDGVLVAEGGLGEWPRRFRTRSPMIRHSDAGQGQQRQQPRPRSGGSNLASTGLSPVEPSAARVHLAISLESACPWGSHLASMSSPGLVAPSGRVLRVTRPLRGEPRRPRRLGLEPTEDTVQAGLIQAAAENGASFDGSANGEVCRQLTVVDSQLSGHEDPR